MFLYRWLTLNPWRAAKRRLTGCCLLTTLALLLGCGLFFGLSILISRLAAAQTRVEPGYEVLLLIDNSNSMFEKAGLGSDPELLRLEAARLFIHYLGVDSHGPAHRLGVIFFGGKAELVVPLVPLADENSRTEIARLINEPARLRWTDPAAALRLANDTFANAPNPTAQRAVVLLTDGKPEWSNEPAAGEKADAVLELRKIARQFATQNTPLFIILLQNEATDADPELEQVYVPLWQELAEATPPGRFYRARRGEDLLDVYHDIVVTLTRRQSAGVVLHAQVEAETLEPVRVEPNLAQVTLVIRKSDPALQVRISRPDGRRLGQTEAGVQYAGRPGQSREEIWAISRPEPGWWQVRLSGQGTVTVWKDFYPALVTPTPAAAPPPSPSPSLPPATATEPSRPATPTATAAAVALLTRPATPGLPAAAVSRPGGWGPALCWGGVLPLLALAGAGGWWWVKRRQRRPLLSGALRVIASPSPAGPVLPPRLDLDQLNRGEVRLGSGSEAGLPLAPGCPPAAASLIARPGPAGETAVMLHKLAGSVLVNNLPVSLERALHDGDVIELGGYRFKYENLRQRKR
jgi:hypothetical protein